MLYSMRGLFPRFTLAIVFTFLLLHGGCRNPLVPVTVGNTEFLTEVQFVELTANGSEDETTTWLTMVFNGDIRELNEADITIQSSYNNAMLSLIYRDLAGEPTIPGVYYLRVFSVDDTGDLTVTIEKSGYRFAGSPKKVLAFYCPPDNTRNLISVSADGNPTTTTAKLSFIFDQDLIGLEEYDILLESSSYNISKGRLTRIADGTYELPVVISPKSTLSIIPIEEQITVYVDAGGLGYEIAGSPVELTVYYAIPVEFQGLSADGSDYTTTGELTVTLNRDIGVLLPEHISLGSGGTGADIASIAHSTGTGEYVLGVDGINKSGELSVTVSKPGYAVSGGPRTVEVSYAHPVEFVSIAADGSIDTGTSKLSLSFGEEIPGLEAEHILLSDPAIIKGALTGPEILEPQGTKRWVYELPVSDIAGSGTITVEVKAPGYNVSTSIPNQKTWDIYIYTPPVNVSFIDLTADGTPVSSTTRLILELDMEIPGLTGGDIILVPENAWNKGVLDNKGNGVYELPLTRVSASGEMELTVSITKSGSGYIVSPAKSVSVYYAAPRTFSAISANGSLRETSTRLTLTFNSSIAGLSAADISITDIGDTGAEIAGLTGSGPAYTLALSGIASSGEITVTVYKEGFNITNAGRNVQVFYAEPVEFTRLTAINDGIGLTTGLELQFDKDIPGLSLADISIVSSPSGVWIDSLTYTGYGLYSLNVHDVPEGGGLMIIAVGKDTFEISSSQRTVWVSYMEEEDVFYSVSANGSSMAVTSQIIITFNFNTQVLGLSENDIIIEDTGNTGVQKNGSLVSDGIQYRLPVSGIRRSGEVKVNVISGKTVTIGETIYSFIPNSDTVTIWPVYAAFESLTEDSQGVNTTSTLSLEFSEDIAGLSAADIGLADTGGTGAQKGALTPRGSGVYDLAVSGISANGELTVSVAKDYYNISPSSRNVDAYYFIPAAFQGLSANGSDYTTTSELTLTFDSAIAGLTAGDITLNPGSTGAVKGSLSGAGPVYTLALTGISAGGQIGLTVSKAGYAITNAGRNVTVSYAAPVNFTGLGANGGAYATTNSLVLSFDSAISNLNASDISMDSGATGAVIAGVTRTGQTAYTLTIGGVTKNGTVSVDVSKSGYAVSGGPLTANIYYAEPVSFTSLTANGSSGEITTSSLTLTFDKDVPGLTLGDIVVFDPGSTGAQIDLAPGAEIPRTGVGSYTVPVSGITAAGQVTITIMPLAGYAISGGPRSRTVHINTVTFDRVSHDGSLTKTTGVLTLSFNKDIADLTVNDITITPNNTGAARDTLTRTGTGVYELTISGVGDNGSIGVGVSKPAYLINPAGRNIDINYAIPVSFTDLSSDDTASAALGKLTLVFSQNISSLSADDITLSAGAGAVVSKGLLTRIGTGRYELDTGVISAPSGAFITLTVDVSKPGYAVSGGPRQVQVRNPVSFTEITQNGSDAAGASLTTSLLTLSFSKDIDGLEAADITLVDSNGTGITGGVLSRTGAGTYNLAVSGVEASGQIRANVSKAGFSITPAGRNINIYYVTPVSFDGLSANGTPTSTTTSLRLDFSREIFGLTRDNIILVPESTWTKGQLGYLGSGSYELSLTDITAGGQVTVSVSISAYSVTPPQSVMVYYAAPRTFTGLSANGSPTETTSELLLSFNDDIPGLNTGNIIINPGNTGALIDLAPGALIPRTGVGTYTVPISGIVRTGIIQVNVARDGFNISGGPRNEWVINAGDIPFTISFQQISNLAPSIPGPVLYRVSNGGPTRETLTLEDPGQYDSISWRIQGTELGTGDTFELKAEDHPVGEHFVTLNVTRNGVPYNKTISFWVEY